MLIEVSALHHSNVIAKEIPEKFNETITILSHSSKQVGIQSHSWPELTDQWGPGKN